jgi:hypothetical protein
MKTASASTMKTASASTMKTASAATMKTASAPAAAMTAPPVLSECGICQECKTDDRSKCDERSAKTDCAHNLYLPLELGSALSREPIVKRTAPYFIRFYC